jgi:CheY-like chemotaxis protein
MSPEVLARITEPFFTTRGAQGTGLGLSVVQKVVQRHGGGLEFTSEVGRGTTAVVTLPSAQAAREAAATPSRVEAVSVPDALVVDDDERVLHSIRAVLMSAGLSSEGAPNAGKGLERFEEYLRSAGHGPWVVVTDLRMPGLAGTDLARRVKEMAPETRVVVVSAYLDSRGTAILPPYVDALLRKPFSATELLMHVGERAEA